MDKIREENGQISKGINQELKVKGEVLGVIGRKDE